MKNKTQLALTNAIVAAESVGCFVVIPLPQWDALLAGIGRDEWIKSFVFFKESGVIRLARCLFIEEGRHYIDSDGNSYGPMFKMEGPTFSALYCPFEWDSTGRSMNRRADLVTLNDSITNPNPES